MPDFNKMKSKEKTSEPEVDNEETKDTEAADKTKKQEESSSFKITSEVLDTMLRESKILDVDSDEAENKGGDINELSYKTMVMKLIHYQLVNDPA